MLYILKALLSIKEDSKWAVVIIAISIGYIYIHFLNYLICNIQFQYSLYLYLYSVTLCSQWKKLKENERKSK